MLILIGKGHGGGFLFYDHKYVLIFTDPGIFFRRLYMKKTNVIFVVGAAMSFYTSTICGGPDQSGRSAVGSGVRDTIAGKALSVTAVKNVILKDTLKDTVAVPQEMQQFQTVSPRILFGLWRGRDTLGREVSFTFVEIKAGEVGIFSVVVQVGKHNVSATCTDWENNMCNLMLNTKEVQNIQTRWYFKYDGTWLEIQIGDNQRIAGSNTFKLKKTESH
jgi:hypothetical protein